MFFLSANTILLGIAGLIMFGMIVHILTRGQHLPPEADHNWIYTRHNASVGSWRKEPRK